MATLILDPRQSERLQAERHARGQDKFDEVWEGVYVMAPAPNDEHQQLATRLARPFLDAVEDPGRGLVRLGINLASDPADWEHNYRVPDLAVFLNDSPAVCHNAFWSGPPDFLVEIVSPYDKTREKIGFYSQVGTRELLIVDRDPWRLELYRLENGKLAIVQTLAPGDAGAIDSAVLPIRFRLIAGQPRPVIEITAKETGRSWTI